MNVLLLVDERFATAEHAMLERLETGLVDEGVRVVHALPDTLDTEVVGGTFATQVVHSRDSSLVPRRVRARWLLQRVAAALDRKKTPEIDIVHAYGESLWPLAAATADAADSPLALEAWSTRSIDQLTRFEATRRTGSPPTLLLADEGLVEPARDAGATWRLTPWGVHVRSEARSLLPADRAPAIALHGPGSDKRALRRALEGIARAIEPLDMAVVFADHDAAHAADLWTLARELGIRDRLSLIPNLEGDRQLVLRTDLMVAPEPNGEVHSMLLDAMGCGLAVVAAHEPALSMLADGRTARVLSSTEPRDWTAAIRGLLDEPDAARRLGLGAWSFIREHRRASAHVTAVLDTYEWMTAADALPFTPAGR